MDAPNPQLTVDVLVDRYVKLRDRIKQAEDAHKERMKPAKDMLEQLNNQLLDAINKSGAESISTVFGTAYRNPRTSVSIEDGEQFRPYVIANELWDLVDWKANKTAVEDYLKEFESLPPGVKITTAYVAGVRRAGKE